MTSVSLPVTLTAGTNENVNDLNADLNALVSAINGNLDEVNVPNLAAAFTSYKNLLTRQGRGLGAVAGGTYLLAQGQMNLPTANGSADAIFWLDPAHHNANARVTKLRIDAIVAVNNTAPGITYTYSLFPVTSTGGGASTLTSAYGALVAGSSATIATPVLGQVAHATGADFNCPVAGAYAIGVALSGAEAANSQVNHVVTLQMRQV